MQRFPQRTRSVWRSICFGLSLLVCCSAITKPALAKRPNILFAFADDWGRYAGAYAALSPGGLSDVVRTPHFDRVARQGVLFRHAFVTAPSCTPCRSSLLSGQYFWRTGRGAILQGAVWDPQIPTFPLLLKDGGYHIGHSYKVWSPGTPTNAPYGAKAYAYNKRGNRFSGFSQVVSRSDDPQATRQAVLDEVRGNFRDFLADRQQDEPFCYWFGPTNCHRKWIQGSGKALWGLNPDDLRGKLPKFLPDQDVVRQDVCDYLGEVQAFDAALGVLLDELQRIGAADNTLMIVSGDHGMPGMPRGKCNLYDFGVAVPLAISWKGHFPGPRVCDDFVNLMDLAPTLLDAAGSPVPDVMTGRSLLPILTSRASGQVDPTRDHVIVGRERHVAAARTGQLPYPQRALRTKDFLYIRNFAPERWPMGTAPGYGQPAAKMPAANLLQNNTFVAFGDLDASPTKAFILTHRQDAKMAPFFDLGFGRRPAEELYELSSDPDQVHNLADDPRFAATRSQLQGRLMDALKRTGDPRVVGDGRTFDRPPFAGPIPRRKNRKNKSR